MNIIAAVYNVAADQSAVTAYTDRVAAGSLLAYVVRDGDLIRFATPDKAKVYGGEVVSAALLRKPKMGATVAARREFGRTIVVA